MVTQVVDSSAKSPRRYDNRLSLPLIPISSPLSVPFTSSLRSVESRQPSTTTSSESSCTTSPSGDLPSPGIISTAYIAARSSADLIRVLGPDMDRGDRRIMDERESPNRGKMGRFEDDRPLSYGDAGMEPVQKTHTPLGIPRSSPQSPFTPLTRDNMAKLKANKRGQPVKPSVRLPQPRSQD